MACRCGVDYYTEIGAYITDLGAGANCAGDGPMEVYMAAAACAGGRVFVSGAVEQNR